MSLTFRYDTVGISLSSDRASFIDFTASYLSAFRGMDENDFTPDWRLEARLLFEGQLPQCERETNWRVGRSIRVGPHALSHAGNRVAVELEMKDERVLMVNVHAIPLSLRQRLGRIRRRISPRHDYQFYLRRMFHFPLFTLLGLNGFFVGHGTALKIGDKTLILMGVSETGKSTLGLMIQLQRPDARFITDNYVIVSSDSILPFPEPLRVNKKLWKPDLVSDQFQFAFKIKDRNYYLARDPAIGRQDVGEYILLAVGRGEYFDVNPMPPEWGWGIFYSTTLALPREFHYSNYTAFMAYLENGAMAPTCPPTKQPGRSFRVVIPDLDSALEGQTITERLLNYVL